MQITFVLDMDERQLSGLELLQTASEKKKKNPITQPRLKTAFSTQKSYPGPKGKASSKVHWATQGAIASWRSGLQIGVTT